jgi:hypothetical protein
MYDWWAVGSGFEYSPYSIEGGFLLDLEACCCKYFHSNF